MSITLPPLPYAADALAPHLGERTLGFHHGKHHQTYVTNLVKLIEGTELAGQPLEAIVRASAGDPGKAGVFNNAAQVWNHTFYCVGLGGGGGGRPAGRLAERLTHDFGGVEAFLEQFKQAGLTQFGSGWAWLVEEGGALKVVKTANADTPLVQGQRPLLTVDVWEHAYYLDFQNRRADYLDAFLAHLVDWAAVAARLG
jgi:Fe-Mn family superoxide dismutase